MSTETKPEVGVPAVVAPSLARKLAEVMAAVREVPKSGNNTFHQYRYSTEADIVRDVRVELGKRAVIARPTLKSVSWRDGPATTKGGKQYIATVMVGFTWVDGESGEEWPEQEFPGEGMDGADKALYKAITGAEKYFIKTQFLMPVGDEDPENERTAVDESSSASMPSNVQRASAVQSGKRTNALKQQLSARRIAVVDVEAGQTESEAEAKAASPVVPADQFGTGKGVAELTMEELSNRIQFLRRVVPQTNRTVQQVQELVAEEERRMREVER